MQTTRAPDDTPEKRRARGQRIRWAREIVEPNRLAFARKLGVDVSTIRNIENGKANPGVQLAHRICHSIRISLDYIVEGQLIGVDPELAGQLVADHPELDPRRQRPPKPGSARKGRRSNTFPMTAAAFFQQ
jgi:DNA-binding XRE family transcriptional regulator